MSHLRGSGAAIVLCGLLAALSACGPGERDPGERQPRAERSPVSATGLSSPSHRVYVTNELSGDMTVIDGDTHRVLATVPLGKRPRGIQLSPDGTQLFVALSGSPIAGPEADERTLPPADPSADGIGIFDLGTQRLGVGDAADDARQAPYRYLRWRYTDDGHRD